jgi:hypothetical protein
MLLRNVRLSPNYTALQPRRLFIITTLRSSNPTYMKFVVEDGDLENRPLWKQDGKPMKG